MARRGRKGIQVVRSVALVKFSRHGPSSLGMITVEPADLVARWLVWPRRERVAYSRIRKIHQCWFTWTMPVPALCLEYVDERGSERNLTVSCLFGSVRPIETRITAFTQGRIAPTSPGIPHVLIVPPVSAPWAGLGVFLYTRTPEYAAAAFLGCLLVNHLLLPLIRTIQRRSTTSNGRHRSDV